ncbi:hypothetical protein CF319_g8568 [Tilletia indica]|nr:hypothetical protein CF319_g8568 [Tilletia indica]
MYHPTATSFILSQHLHSSSQQLHLLQQPQRGFQQHHSPSASSILITNSAASSLPAAICRIQLAFLLSLWLSASGVEVEFFPPLHHHLRSPVLFKACQHSQTTHPSSISILPAVILGASPGLVSSHTSLIRTPLSAPHDITRATSMSLPSSHRSTPPRPGLPRIQPQNHRSPSHYCRYGSEQSTSFELTGPSTRSESTAFPASSIQATRCSPLLARRPHHRHPHNFPESTTAVCILLQHSSTCIILDFEHIPGVEVEATPSATRHESDSERDENAVIKVHMVVTFAPSSVTTEVKSAVEIHHKQLVQGLLGDIIGSNANNISVPDIRRGTVCCCGIWYHSQQRRLRDDQSPAPLR